MRLGKCQRREVAVDAVREGKGVQVRYNVATVALRSRRIRRRGRLGTLVWLILGFLRSYVIRVPVLIVLRRLSIFVLVVLFTVVL